MRGQARAQTQVSLALKPVLLTQRTHSVLGLPPLLPSKMWLLWSFPGPEKGYCSPQRAEGGLWSTLALWSAQAHPEGWRTQPLRGLASRRLLQLLRLPHGFVRLCCGLRYVSSLLCPVLGSSSLSQKQGPAWAGSPWQTQAPLWSAVVKRIPDRKCGPAETHAFLNALLPLEEGPREQLESLGCLVIWLSSREPRISALFSAEVLPPAQSQRAASLTHQRARPASSWSLTC